MEAIAAMAANPGPKDNLFIALTYSALGDFDQAMLALEKCYEIRLDWLPWIAMEGAYGGLLEEIRQDPRFTALMEKLDIPSAPDA